MQARQGQALEFIVQDSIALAGYLPVPDDGLSEPNYQHVMSCPPAFHMNREPGNKVVSSLSTTHPRVIYQKSWHPLILRGKPHGTPRLVRSSRST